jgi:hypothetical protein
MPESTDIKKASRRTKSSRDLTDSEAAQAVPPHILNIVKNVEKRSKKSKRGRLDQLLTIRYIRMKKSFQDCPFKIVDYWFKL